MIFVCLSIHSSTHPSKHCLFPWACSLGSLPVLFLFPIKSCFAANHLTWTKFVGIQEMQKSFFFNIWDRWQSERLSSLGSVPGYLRTVSGCHVFENGPPCQVTWVTVLDTTWPQSSEGPEIMEQLTVHLETILLRLQQSSLPLSLTFRQITFQQQ